MIFSSIHANDDLKRYPIAIQKAIEYAKTTDFSGLEDGKHEIDGDKMFVNLFHLTSKPKEETHPELHKRYADVQFWICGEELCGVAPFIGKGECIDAREDDDLYFYDGIECASCYLWGCSNCCDECCIANFYVYFQCGTRNWSGISTGFVVQLWSKKIYEAAQGVLVYLIFWTA